jgi:hypothetical protein
MANFNDVVGLTKKWEGGLSSNPKDSASKYPSPYIYKGKKGWHTNKGITYKTFKDYATKLGYEDSATNFITMPDTIWNKIAKAIYWDTLKLDTLKSNGIAFQLFSAKWGGWKKKLFVNYLAKKGIKWDGKDSTISSSFNELLQKQSETQIIQDISKLMSGYYVSLNQPAFTQGWLNRVKDTTDYAIQFVRSNVIEPASEQAKKKSNWLIYLSIGLIGYYLLSKRKIRIRI